MTATTRARSSLPRRSAGPTTPSGPNAEPHACPAGASHRPGIYLLPEPHDDRQVIARARPQSRLAIVLGAEAAVVEWCAGEDVIQAHAVIAREGPGREREPAVPATLRIL